MTEILVVDDDQELRETIVEILAGQGFAVREAASADQALALLEESSFALVILDMVMPGTDGMRALPFIKKRQPRAKLMVITAFSSVDHAVQAMKHGADDYLAKPFKLETLLVHVRRLVEEARFPGDGSLPDLDGTFHALANSIRRHLLQLLRQQDEGRFMELTRRLGIQDHTKVNFHLKVLKDVGLVTQKEDRAYLLTEAGVQVAECLDSMVKGFRRP